MKLAYKEYLIGVLIGIIIGLFPINLNYTDKFDYINNIILYIPRSIVWNIYDCWACWHVIITMFILSTLLFTFLGISIVFLIEKLLKFVKNK